MLKTYGERAQKCARILANMHTDEKNELLKLSAQCLLTHQKQILEANEKDVTAAENEGLKGAFIKRLTLNQNKIEDMAEGLLQVSSLPDPVGQYISMKTLPNGLSLGKTRVPLGVIGIIFEARPNVTSDAYGLCLKSGNACILRGGKEALMTNVAIVEALQEACHIKNHVPYFVQLIEDTSRETAREMMRLNQYIDVLIPRGGQSLIQTVVENSTVPVIETGIGNCHVYVDQSADFVMADNIIVNAKTQNVSVCNACESILVHASIAEEFIPLLCKELSSLNVEIRGDETVVKLFEDAKPATEEDFYTEFLDMIVSIKVVASVEEAIDHITKYGTKHSETIVTECLENAQKFLQEVDAACVYANASTRFSDGFEFGFGAEIGISTQKLHARGPMGLEELTSYKYMILGTGQIRK